MNLKQRQRHKKQKQKTKQNKTKTIETKMSIIARTGRLQTKLLRLHQILTC